MSDKGKWSHTPGDEVYGEVLILPSFGVRVTRSDPRTESFLTGQEAYGLAPDSSDTFSISYLHHKGDATPADRSFMGMDIGYVRRVLLRILDGEEYQEVLDHYNARNRLEPKPGVPKGKPLTILDVKKVKDPDPKAQVRITDLRIAKDLELNDLKRELKEEMAGLTTPITTDGVLRWKWKTLRKPKGMRVFPELYEREDWHQEELIRTMSISFAAAALCLCIDLDMKDLDDYSRDDLTTLVLKIHEMIEGSIRKVDTLAAELSKLLAGQKGGRPPDPDFKHYTALVLYRMGRPPYEIARRIGLGSPDPPKWKKAGIADEESKFNDNWRNKLISMIQKGIEIEKEKFPLAAEVFTSKDEEETQDAARAAYNDYLDSQSWTEVTKHLESFDVGDDLLNTPTSETEQEMNALIQLGSCIRNGRDPLSPNLAEPIS